MAFTLNNLIGFETGGLEEANSINNAPIVQGSVVNTGAFALHFDNVSADQYFFEPFEGQTSDAGDQYAIGFAFRTDDLTVSANYVLFRATGTGSNQISLAVDASTAELVLLDSTLTEVGRSTPTLSVDTWHYIEVYWENADPGVAEVFLDGVQVISVAAEAFFLVAAFDTLVVEGTTANSHNIYFDDIYTASGLTAASELLGPSEVIPYRSNKASATPDDGGADLDIGQWVDVQTIPFSGSIGAEYTASSAAGAVDTDDVGGSAGTGGPATDNNITGPINGVKAICRMERGGGGASAHFILLGNDGDGTTRSADLNPSNQPANFFFVSEAATIVPTASEVLRIGFETTGAQDFECYDMLGQILHTPVAAISADGDATLEVIEAAGTADRVVQADDGAPALAPFVAAGTAERRVQADDGAPTLAVVEAAGTAEANAPVIDADGAATLAVVEAAGVATRGVQAADGAPALVPVEAAGTAERRVQADDGAPALVPIEASGAAAIGGADVTADGDATLEVIEAAGTAERRVQADDGAPALAVVEAAGVATRGVGAADGAPELTPVEAAGTATHGKEADGAATLAVVEAAGVATRGVQAADGAPALTPVEAAGTAARRLQADDGAPSIAAVEAAGTAERRVQAADGAPALAVVVAAGTASIDTGAITANGAALIPVVIAAGVAVVRRQASGAITLAVIEAAGIVVVPVPVFETGRRHIAPFFE